MNDDPESLNAIPAPDDPGRESTGPEPVAAPEAASDGEPLHNAAQVLSWPAPHDPLAAMRPEAEFPAPLPVAPPHPSLIPHIGHFLVFLALIIPALVGGYLLTILTIFLSDPRGGVGHLFSRLTTLTKSKDLLFAISMQGALYIVLWGLAALVFGLWWHGFLRGVQWNASAARRRIILLAIAGVATGFLITIAGNFVPMPKTAPILEDITTSRAGAWVLLVFGVTLAPLTEELAFRGFLLPSLINIFRWFQRRGDISESVVRLFGVPLCIVLTSIPFALMHAEQVSDSWGPVLLIGCVSIILCVVRLQLRSVAAGVLVHSFYNLTLFTGLLIQSDGFRHLDKLKA
jgi:uncharacterized protein